MDIKVQVTQPDVEKFIQAFPILTGECVKSAAIFGQGRLVRATPVATGQVRAAYEIARMDQLSFLVHNLYRRGKWYIAKLLDRGTGLFGPYGTPILPVKAKFLRFRNMTSSKGTGKGNTPGAWIFAKSVKGMKAHRMLDKARKPTIDFLSQRIARAVREMWRQMPPVVKRA
jgi:hypothetical protein